MGSGTRGRRPRSALERLAAFLESELAGQLPPALRERYANALAEARGAIAAQDPTPLERLGLDARTFTFLTRAGYTTVGALASAAPDELAAVPYMGPDRLRRVGEALARHVRNAD